MPKRSKFTRLPKAEDLIPLFRKCGLGLHVLPTYYALMDHGNNKTGVCWPSINRLASILGVCRRTVERHLEALVSAGLVLKSSQRRYYGREHSRWGQFSVCRYCVVAMMFFKRSTVRHQGRTKSPVPNKVLRTKPFLNKKSTETLEEKRAREAQRRREQMIEVYGPAVID